jgi:polar amino acid transport system substrate-binding protein
MEDVKKMMRSIVFVSVCLGICGGIHINMVQAGENKALSLAIITEEFPPYNYTENNKIIGIATEVVEAVMNQTGINYTIKSYPWARTYNTAKKMPNTLIYSINRTPQREKLFKWVGAIVPINVSMFCLSERSDIRVDDYNDLKQYKIGTILDDAFESYLIDKGLDVSNFVRLSGDKAYQRSYRMLKAGRIEIMPMMDAVAYYVVRKVGDDPKSMLRRLFSVTELSQSSCYIAASPKTPADVVNKIRNVLEDFKKTSNYKELLKKWGVQE